jgi:type IV pilus assembly protein PilM
MANAAPLKRPGVWGIDLGQCALKAIRLEELDGEVVATAFDYIEHPKILSQPDADPDQLTREALEKFLERNNLKGDTVAISVPGQSGLARFVKLPPVDEKKIPDIVRFEAKQQIPFPLEEVVWAYQRLGAGDVTDNMVLDAEIGLFAMKRDMINRYLQHFKDVNVEVHLIQMAPLALCNFMAHDLLGKGASKGGEEEGSGDKSCVVALDIGADNSNLVITDGEKIIWQRPIPLGGNHFTRALTKDLKLTFAQAEHLKRNAVKSPDLKKILAALKPVLNDFVSEVQRSLGYFTNTHRDATIQYMIGLGNAFRLPGLQKYLQEKLQLEVRKLQKINRLAGEESVTAAPQYVENVLSFAVAHGLALQGLKATRLHTNLLPPEIAQDRYIRAKKPWAAAAAAVLLLWSPPLLFGYAAGMRVWANPRLTDATKKLDGAVKAAKNDVDQYTQATGQASDAEEKLEAMAGGVSERLYCLHLYTYIDEAIPKPDGSRLASKGRTGKAVWQTYYEGKPSQPQETVYNGRRGLDDYTKLREILASPNPPAEKVQDMMQGLEEARKLLVQVHIEGINALYSDNLPVDYFAKLIDESNKGKFSYKLEGLGNQTQPGAQGSLADIVRSKKEGAGGLPKAGWIIEIRGYTYHADSYNFVINTFLENLIDLVDDESNKRVEGIKLPRDLKDPKDRELVHALRFVEKTDGGKEVVKGSRISYILLYDYVKDETPRPGEFKKINRFLLKDLLIGGTGGGQFGKDGTPQGMPSPKGSPKGADDSGKGADGGEKKSDSKDRTGYLPPGGTVLADAFNSAGGLGGYGDPGVGKKGGPVLPPTGKETGKESGGGQNLRRAMRTEFVIHFIWIDAGPPEGGVPADPNKQ